MSKVNDVLTKIGVSKVRLSKYLGVSRQMLYNYLSCKTLEEWPNEKAQRLMQLLEINSENDLDNIKLDGDYIMKIDNKLNEGVKIALSNNSLVELKGFNRKEVEILSEITNILKEKLKDDKTKDTYNTYVYLYHFLQSLDNHPELKYFLGYVSKINGFTKPREFVYNQDQQILLESIVHSGFELYNRGKASKSKIAETHERLVKEIEQKYEEKMSRTQELNTIKMQALQELGYTSINSANVKEVSEKIAEIESRKN